MHLDLVLAMVREMLGGRHRCGRRPGVLWHGDPIVCVDRSASQQVHRRIHDILLLTQSRQHDVDSAEVCRLALHDLLASNFVESPCLGTDYLDPSYRLFFSITARKDIDKLLFDAGKVLHGPGRRRSF